MYDFDGFTKMVLMVVLQLQKLVTYFLQMHYFFQEQILQKMALIWSR